LSSNYEVLADLVYSKNIANWFNLGFMRNRKLNAMTQYFSKCYFPWVTMEDWKQIKQKVLKYFNEEVAHLLPMPDGTIDFVVYPDKIMVIEVNVYGEMAGTWIYLEPVKRLNQHY
jgi:hypothetical protein